MVIIDGQQCQVGQLVGSSNRNPAAILPSMGPGELLIHH